MQTRSDTWIRIAAGRKFRCESIAEIDGVTYASISAPIIERGLFPEALSIGNCVSASLQLSVRSDTEIAQAASIIIKNRIVAEDGSAQSEYLPAGTFWVSRRSYDVVNRLTTFTCYDAMLKTHAVYPIGESASWPKTQQAVVTEIAQLIGVQIDERTAVNADAPMIAKPKGYTIQDVLGFIGVANCGNWIITKDNKLRLVPIASAPTVADLIAGSSFSTFTDPNNDGNIVVTGGESGAFTDPNNDGNIVMTGDAYSVSDTGDGISIETPFEFIDLYGIIGRLTKGREQTISGVILANDQNSDEAYTAGNDNGYVLNCSAPFASQSVANDIFAVVGGMTYHPYTAIKGIYDPAAELGDPIIRLSDPNTSISDPDVQISVISHICKETATYGFAFRSDVSAPANAELEDEYPYLGIKSKKGEDGRSIIGQAVAYAQSSTVTGVDPETLSWGTTIPEVPPGYYLWTRTTFLYSTEPLEEYTYSVAQQGESGVGVASETTYYTVTSDPNAPADPETDPTIWTTTVPTRSEGEYLWESRKTTYTDGSVMYTSPVRVTGDPGDQGDPGTPGVGIQQRTYYYGKTHSNTVPPDVEDPSEWQTTMPDRSWGEYIWRYEYTLYTDGTSNTTAPVCITGDTGSDGLNLVWTADNGTVMQSDRTVTVTLTAEVQSAGTDIDPDGEAYVYRWWQYKDGSSKPTYLGIGKELTLIVNGRLCDVTTGIYFEVIQSPRTGTALCTDNILYGGRKRLVRPVYDVQGTLIKIQYLTARYNWT